ncbi:MAG: hypothetical protein HY320_13910 [Armatimonadetes bacterium]|nr:hypothetical protein [Armatimonadota bacterium]
MAVDVRARCDVQWENEREARRRTRRATEALRVLQLLLREAERTWKR